MSSAALFIIAVVRRTNFGDSAYLAGAILAFSAALMYGIATRADVPNGNVTQCYGIVIAMGATWYLRAGQGVLLATSGIAMLISLAGTFSQLSYNFRPPSYYDFGPSAPEIIPLEIISLTIVGGTCVGFLAAILAGGRQLARV